jgi:hypothetical protein
MDNILLNPLSQQSKRITVPGVPLRGTVVVRDRLRCRGLGLLGSIGLGIIRGRGITAADAPGAPHVAVINEEMARPLLAGQRGYRSELPDGFSRLPGRRCDAHDKSSLAGRRAASVHHRVAHQEFSPSQ